MKAKYETITVELLEYDELSHDYIALYNGKEISVDPYVDETWKDDDVRLGEFTFEGSWWTLDKNVFLTTREVRPFEQQLCEQIANEHF